MKKINKTPLAAAMGAAFISTFAATAANAETSPAENRSLRSHSRREESPNTRGRDAA
jgi:hypothetical protein